jgi:CheY-like chemotaxis protein
MTTFAEFRDQLRDALPHLHDPGFVCPVPLCESLGLPSDRAVGALRDRVRDAIQRLAPEADCPQDTRAHRFHHILSLRYLQKLTQEQSAERLAITVRHLARQQAQAVEVLARLLWEQMRAVQYNPDGTEADEGGSQVAKEISALSKQAPDRMVDVADAVQQVVALTRVLADRYGIVMQIDANESDLLASCHPSVLQQTLVVAISYLLRHMENGRIALSASREASTIRVLLRADPFPAMPPDDNWVGYKLLTSHSGAVFCEREGDALAMRLTLPSARHISVLVVDDNQDLVQFYHLCTAGTRYVISSLGQGTGLFELIEQLAPDIIVLDLMLPDIDGWELLTQLHEHPLSRETPIVLCSVVQEEELALALGAHFVVSKPLRRQRFLQVLDQALSRVAGAY